MASIENDGVITQVVNGTTTVTATGTDIMQKCFTLTFEWDQDLHFKAIAITLKHTTCDLKQFQDLKMARQSIPCFPVLVNSKRFCIQSYNPSFQVLVLVNVRFPVTAISEYTMIGNLSIYILAKVVGIYFLPVSLNSPQILLTINTLPTFLSYGY